MFLFINTALIHNFIDGNTSASAQTILDLIWVSKLDIACKNVIDWFTLNKIIMNLSKFKAY